jgi:hypothetical protein
MTKDQVNEIMMALLRRAVFEPAMTPILAQSLGKGLGVVLAMVQDEKDRAELRSLLFAAITEHSETVAAKATQAMSDKSAFKRFLQAAVNG